MELSKPKRVDIHVEISRLLVKDEILKSDGACLSKYLNTLITFLKVNSRLMSS
jgi:hypothetical protein